MVVVLIIIFNWVLIKRIIKVLKIDIIVMILIVIVVLLIYNLVYGVIFGIILSVLFFVFKIFEIKVKKIKEDIKIIYVVNG